MSLPRSWHDDERDEWRELEDVPLPGETLPPGPTWRYLCSACGAIVSHPDDACECEVTDDAQ